MQRVSTSKPTATAQGHNSGKKPPSSAPEDIDNHGDDKIKFGFVDDSGDDSLPKSDDESLPKIATNVLHIADGLFLDADIEITFGTVSELDGCSIANAKPVTDVDELHKLLLEGSIENQRLQKALEESEQALKESKREQQQREGHLAKAKNSHKNESDRQTRRIRKLEHDLRCLALAANQKKGTEIAQQQSISCLRTDNQFLFQQVTELSRDNADLAFSRDYLTSKNDALNRQQTQLLTLNSELKKTHYLQHKSINRLTQQLKSNDQMWVKQKKKLQSEKTGLSGKIDGLTVLLHEYQGKIESMERMMESLRRSSTITTADTQRGAPPSGQGGHDKRLLLRAYDLPQQTNPTPHTDIESMRIIWGRPHP